MTLENSLTDSTEWHDSASLENLSNIFKKLGDYKKLLVKILKILETRYD